MDVEEIRAGRTGSEEGLKSVKAVLDQTPLLSPEMLLLARWMKERYFCTLFDAVRVMLRRGFIIRSPALIRRRGIFRRKSWKSSGRRKSG